MEKGCILFYRKKGNLQINKNYKSKNLTSIAAKFYYKLFLNRIRRDVE